MADELLYSYLQRLSIANGYTSYPDFLKEHLYHDQIREKKVLTPS